MSDTVTFNRAWVETEDREYVCFDKQVGIERSLDEMRVSAAHRNIMKIPQTPNSRKNTIE